MFFRDVLVIQRQRRFSQIAQIPHLLHKYFAKQDLEKTENYFLTLTLIFASLLSLAWALECTSFSC